LIYRDPHEQAAVYLFVPAALTIFNMGAESLIC
jgi:hypothetical protein